jgi:hypothetical protein
MSFWGRGKKTLEFGEHAEFIWKILEFLGFDRPINWLIYAAGSGMSGYLAGIASWPPIGIFLAVIGAGVGLSLMYAIIHRLNHYTSPNAMGVSDMDRITINASEIYSQTRKLPDGEYIEWLVPIHFTKSCIQCRVKYHVKKSIDDRTQYAEFSSLGEKTEDFLAGESRDIGMITIPINKKVMPSFSLAHVKLPAREQAYVPSENIIEYSVVKADAPDAPAKVYRVPLRLIAQPGNNPPQVKIGVIETIISKV